MCSLKRSPSILTASLLGIAWLAGLIVPAEAQRQTLTVYSLVHKEDRQAVKEAFEKRHPNITLNLMSPGGGEAALVRLKAERAQPVADVYHAGSAEDTTYAVEQGLLEKLPADVSREVPDTFRIGQTEIPLKDKQGYSATWGFLFHGLVYNEDRVKALNLPIPNSWEDLTRPEYQGKILFIKPQVSSTALTFVFATHQMFGSRVWDFWDRFDKNIAFYVDSSGALYGLIAKGEVPFGVGLHTYVYQRREAGQRINIVFPREGVGYLDDTVAIVKGSRNLDAARQFIRWSFSREGQEVTARRFYHPVVAGVPSPDTGTTIEHALAGTRVLMTDPHIATRWRDEIMKRFDQYVRAKRK